MSLGIGVSVQRLRNKLRDAYAVLGISPKFRADFIRNKYKGHSTFSSAITHARAGNATMTDGYGPELVTNGSFDSDVSGWTATGVIERTRLGRLRLYGASLTPDRYIHQTLTTVSGKTYLVTVDLREESGGSSRGLVRVGTSGANSTDLLSSPYFGEGSQTFTFTATGTSSTLTLFWDDSGTSDYSEWDNVSVREMPVIKWAPHNLLTYSEDPSSSLTSTNDASWTSNNTLTATAQSGNQTPYARVLQTFTQKGTYVFAVETTGTTVQYLTLQTQIFDANANGVSVFDIQSGSVNTEASQHTATITATSSGFLCAIEFELDGTDLNGYLTMGLSEVSGIHRIIDPDGTESVTVTRLRSYRSDLGGMVDNPDRGDSYVPTASRPFGPELFSDFDLEGEWVDNSDGSYTVTNATGNTDIRNSNFVTSGKTYEYKFTITGDTLTVYLGVTSPEALSAGTYTKVVTANTSWLIFRAQAGETATVSNISVKETVNPATARYLPRVGHHVYNGSAWVNEGVLAESESRTNLVDYSDFSSGWIDGGTNTLNLTENSAVSPDGTQNALEVESTGSGLSSYIKPSSAVFTNGLSVTVSVYAKAGTNSIVRIANNSSSDNGAWFDLSDGTIGTNNDTGGHGNTANIEDVGNGWYRLSRYFGSVTAGSNDIIIGPSDADDSVGTAPANATMYFYGVQAEVGATRSSLIPTSGSSVTRAVETFTIPSANLPWPEPQSITGNVYSGTDPVNITGAHTFTPTIADDSSTKVVRVKWTQTLNSGTRTRMRFRNAANSADVIPSKYYNGSGTFEEIIVTSTGLLWLQIENAVDVDISGITLEEINPLSICIAVEGRLTYADIDLNTAAFFFQWYAGGSRYIRYKLTTSGSRQGQIDFLQRESTSGLDLVDTISSYLQPDILVPYNIAGRHGSTFINGATDGVALTADTTPTALPDLSTIDLSLAYKYMGTISEFRVWDKDITDAGLVEATNPSLEPSLSLTFEGTGTNSFVVNDWAE